MSGHLDPEFLGLMDATVEALREVMRTSNRLTLPLSGTGSAGMEAALVNVLEPGERLVVCVNGLFGGQMAEIGRRLGARVEELAFAWGAPVDPAALENALRKPAAVVAVVHAETSTGVASPVPELAAIARRNGALFVLDCVTSLAGMP